MIPLAALGTLATALLPGAAGFIGQMLAGPRGEAAARQITDAVAATVSTVDPIAARLTLEQSPEAAQQLRIRLEEIIAEHAQAIAAADLDAQRIAAANTADARAHALAMVQAGQGTRMRDAIAIASVMVFLVTGGVCLWAVSTNQSSELVGLAGIILGAAIAGYNDVRSYFLGSSIGSAAKDQRIAALTPPRNGNL